MSDETESMEDLEKAGAEALENEEGVTDTPDPPNPQERSRGRARLAEQRAEAADGEDTREPTPKEAEEKAARLEKKKAKVVQILDRGILNDKLQSLVDALPDDRVGLMVRNRPEDVDRIRALGGRLERRSNLTRDVAGVHGDGGERLRVGDVVLMSIDLETAQVIDMVQDEQVENKLKRGKREYRQKAQQNREVPIIDYSHQQVGGNR